MIEGNTDQDYLGDGVYALFDGYQIWLATQQGDRIALEPQVMRALKVYEKQLLTRLAATEADRETQP